MIKLFLVLLWIPLLSASAGTGGALPELPNRPYLQTLMDGNTSCSDVLTDTGQMKTVDTVTLKRYFSRLHLHRSPNIQAKSRPIIVLIPGGPGLSSNTLRRLNGLLRHFDVVFVDPPGIGRDQEKFFQGHLGSLYDRVVEDIANALHWNINGDREIVLLGHSYGGTIAADIAAKYKKTLLQNLTGLVLMAAAQTSHTFRAMSRKRNSAVGTSPEYLKYKLRLIGWQEEFWTPKIIDYAKRHGVPLPAERLTRSLTRSDRSNYVKYILLQSTLLWTDAEAEIVRELIHKEIDYCSPPALRLAQKDWSEDRNQGDFTVRGIRRLDDLRVVSLIGQSDGYYPSQMLQAEAEAMGAKYYVFQNGSHFFYVTYTNEVIELVYREFAQKRN